mmetsp:Transcript_14107/g.47069  ORF Transcript_14107/g.47069 Transcript_14107/m.47069 type:complete len:467 (+) Transcript_14107:154-1554(+)
MYNCIGFSASPPSRLCELALEVAGVDGSDVEVGGVPRGQLFRVLFPRRDAGGTVHRAAAADRLHDEVAALMRPRFVGENEADLRQREELREFVKPHAHVLRVVDEEGAALGNVDAQREAANAGGDGRDGRRGGEGSGVGRAERGEREERAFLACLAARRRRRRPGAGGDAERRLKSPVGQEAVGPVGSLGVAVEPALEAVEARPRLGLASLRLEAHGADLDEELCARRDALELPFPVQFDAERVGRGGLGTRAVAPRLARRRLRQAAGAQRHADARDEALELRRRRAGRVGLQHVRGAVRRLLLLAVVCKHFLRVLLEEVARRRFRAAIGGVQSLGRDCDGVAHHPLLLREQRDGRVAGGPRVSEDVEPSAHRARSAAALQQRRHRRRVVVADHDLAGSDVNALFTDGSRDEDRRVAVVAAALKRLDDALLLRGPHAPRRRGTPRRRGAVLGRGARAVADDPERLS